uniref:Coiled-coil domain-containing protein n=1 Tax=Syphacia muris TaxID=451379 RepID=A0A0N5AFW3_9BILA
MADDLLDNYNPLYDVHLQQYFASPHMQKHLRRIGLLGNRNEYDGRDENDVYNQHNVTMDLLLKNREKQLAKLATLQKKLDAAEKVEICRKIRSGQTPGTTQPRSRPSRSLSRGPKAATRNGRRSSTSTDDKDLIKRIESEGEETPRANATVYSRLSASVGKYRYLHKLDDYTLSAYMEELRKQLRRLERFRDVSFGPHSVARHPSEPQESWFFRRRSLPSFSDSGHANSVHEHLRYTNAN